MIATLFITTGRPSTQQPEMMRLLVVMSDQCERDIDKWVKAVSITPQLYAPVLLVWLHACYPPLAVSEVFPVSFDS